MQSCDCHRLQVSLTQGCGKLGSGHLLTAGPRPETYAYMTEFAPVSGNWKFCPHNEQCSTTVIFQILSVPIISLDKKNNYQPFLFQSKRSGTRLPHDRQHCLQLLDHVVNHNFQHLHTDRIAHSFLSIPQLCLFHLCHSVVVSIAWSIAELFKPVRGNCLLGDYAIYNCQKYSALWGQYLSTFDTHLPITCSDSTHLRYGFGVGLHQNLRGRSKVVSI